MVCVSEVTCSLFSDYCFVSSQRSGCHCFPPHFVTTGGLPAPGCRLLPSVCALQQLAVLQEQYRAKWQDNLQWLKTTT